MRWLALGLAALLGCGAVRGPELDPQEHPRGEHQRLVQEPFERLWPAVLRGLDAEGFRVAHEDRARGAIATRTIRYAGRDVGRRLAEIGDLSRARSAGLERVSELAVTYYLLLAPAGDAGTRVRIRSTIEAIDRSDTFLVAPGVFPLGARRVDVPSRGVLEHDLMRHLAANLFTAEEMLFMLGELGVD
jgi:hypothetical protein